MTTLSFLTDSPLFGRFIRTSPDARGFFNEIVRFYNWLVQEGVRNSKPVSPSVSSTVRLCLELTLGRVVLISFAELGNRCRLQ